MSDGDSSGGADKDCLDQFVSVQTPVQSRRHRDTREEEQQALDIVLSPVSKLTRFLRTQPKAKTVSKFD